MTGTTTSVPIRRATERSAAAFEDAQRVMPGGVNSPVRAFRGVGGTPVFYDRAEGPRFWDLDGYDYLDYVLSWGPLILGHAHPAVIERVNHAVSRGTSYGAPTLAETKLAELVSEMVPGIEQVRFVSSGTEATMSALRLARAATGRDKIVKFAGCYHGHADLLLVQAGSGVATLGLPDSPGVPKPVTADTLVAPYNDLSAVAQLFATYPEDIAAIIVEPIAANMGVVTPESGYLQGLRDLCTRHGAMLIYDEVMTGFRVDLGGASAHYGVTADLVTLGKVIGGGFPLAAYAGPERIMRHVAPAGPMYQGGTLSGNPVATAAGIATLETIREPGVFATISQRLTRLVDGITDAAARVKLPLQSVARGTMGGFFLHSGPVRNYDDAKQSDTAQYGRVFHRLLDHGVYIAPSQFEALFMSIAHTDENVDRTIAAFQEVFAAEMEGA